MKVPTLAEAMTGLENAIITISGPVLAISSIIAGVDILTDNWLARMVGWVSIAWAITLMLTLDFQVLALGAMARRVYISSSGKWRKVGELVLICLIAGALAYVSIQMHAIYARVNGASVSIEIAQAQLGINPLALIYERSAMVLVLIFLAGFLRDEKPEQAAQSAPTIDMPQLFDELERRLDRRIEQMYQQVDVRISQELPAILALPPGGPIQGEQIETVNEPLEPIGGEQGYGDAIAVLYTRNPRITAREVAEQVGCSLSTANKWLQRCKVPMNGHQEGGQR